MAQRHFVIVTFLAAAGALLVLADDASATNTGTQAITSDATWTLAGSPYDVTGTVVVRNGATLTVEPGVTVNLSYGYRLYVGDPNRGTLAERPGHLVLDGTATSPVTVKGGPIELDGWNGAAAASAIRNTTFDGASGWAIEAYTFSPLEVHDSTFLSPGSGGIYLSASSPTIAGTTFLGGPYGVYGTDWQSRPTFAGDTFEDQTTMWARAGAGSRFDGNTYTGTGTAVQLFAGNRWNDADVTLDADDVTFHLHQWLGVRNGATLTIEPGFRALGADDFYVQLSDAWSGTPSLRPGILVAEGTEAAPIVIGSLSGSATNGWDGIQFNGWNGAARESVIRNATLRHAQTHMVYSNQWHNLTMDHVRFENGSFAGVYLESALPLVKDSAFSGSPYGVYATNWASRPTITGSTFWNQTTRYARVGVASTLVDNAFSGPGTAVDLLAGNRWYDDDLTLRAEPVTFHMHNWLGIRNGATLTIEPGFEALGADDFYVEAGDAWSGTPSLRPGAVQALGTVAEPIVIGSLSGSPANGWDGFQFNGWSGAARESALRNVTLRHAQGQNVYANSWSDLTFDNATIESAANDGFYLESASPTIRGSTLRGSSYGVYATSWVSRPTILASTFEDQATRYARVGLTSFLEGNTFSGTGSAVELLAGNRWADETDVTLRDEGVVYDLHNWIGLRNDRTLTVEPGVDVRTASDVTINVGDPWTQATTGVRGAYGVYSLNETAFAFHPGASGNGCNTNGPDLRGYVCEAIPYAFTNISTTGTKLSICDNCVTGAIPIGFDFSFYGKTYSNAYVAENGFLTFSAGQSGGCCSGQALPAYGGPDNLIAGFWDDQRLIQGGDVRYQTVGVAPARSFIVQWTAVPHWPDNNEVATFQIVLREGSDVAEVHLEYALQDGSNHVTGVESAPLPEYPRGRVVMEGTEAMPITFRSLSGSTTNAWNGFRFQGWSGAATSDSVLRNVTIRDSRDYDAHLNTWSVGTWDNVSFGPSASHSLYLDSSSPTFRNADFNGSATYNVFVYSASFPKFHGGTNERAGQYGVYVYDAASDVLLRDVELRQNQRPLRIDLHNDIGGTTFTNNTVQEIEYLTRDYTTDLTVRPYYDSVTNARLASVILQSFSVYGEATLTIDPDVRMLVGDGVTITIGSCCSNPSSRGDLSAVGTGAQPIYVGSRSGNSANGWYGFYLRGGAWGGASELRNVTLAYSRDANLEAYDYDQLTLDNVTNERSGAQAFMFHYSTPVLRNVDAIHPGWEAYYAYQSPVVWRGGLVDHSGRSGFFSSGCGVATLEDIVVESPGSYGYYADGNCNGAHFDHVDFRNVTGRPWRNRLDVRMDASITTAGVDEVEYWGNDITSDRTLAPTYDLADGARMTNVILGSFTVWNNATLTLAPNQTILADNGVSVSVGSCCSALSSRGNLTAAGTQDEPITIRSRSGSTSNGWYGLYFRGGAWGGVSELRNVTLAFSRDSNLETYDYDSILLDNVTTERSAAQGFIFQYSTPTLRNVDALEPGWEAYYAYQSPVVWRGGLVNGTGRSGFYSSGCAVATLEDIVVEGANGYGYYADGNCNGAHFDHVDFRNVTGRPWRNRLDVRIDATITNAGIDEVEHWGNDITTDLTLSPQHDEQDGARLTTAILGGFTVWNTATWTVEPDVRMLVDNGVSINIGSCCSNPTSRGNLTVLGTAEQPVYMGSRTGSTASGWYGLYFRGDYGGGASVLRNVTIALSRDEGIEAYVYHGLTLDNVTLDRNARWGAHFQASSPTLIEPRISRSGSHGIFVQSGGNPTIRGGIIDDSGGYGIYGSGSSDGAQIHGTAIQNSTQRPFRIRVTDVDDAILRNNTLRDAEYWGVDVTGSRTLAPHYDAGDGQRYNSVIVSGFTVRNGATWTVDPDTRLLVENGVAINIGSCCSNPSSRGNLTIEATEDAPVYVGSRTGSTSTGWYGFYFRGDYGGGTSVLRNVTVALSRDEGIETYAYHGLTLDNVTLDRNARWGMQLQSSAPTLKNVVSNGSGSYGAYFSSSSPTWTGGGVRGSGASGIYTSGCGMATLKDLTVEDANGYGFYADSTCNGANMESVHFANTTGRPLRNRLDSAMRNVTVSNAGTAEIELWGMTIGGARTLTLEPVLDAATGESIPTVILGTFTVNGGAILDLAPGLELRFRANEYVNVGSHSGSRGTIQARGTKARPINISGVSSAVGGWGGSSTGGLEFDWGNPSQIANTTIDGAQVHAIRILNDAQVALDNVTIRRSTGSGLVIGAGATMTLEGSNVTRNGARGIYDDGALVMRRSNVSENGHNGVELITASATIEGSILYNNSFSGINVTSGNPSLSVTRSYLWKNGFYGVDLQGTTGSTIVDNAFIENAQGQAHATAANTWNVTPVEGRNIAYGPLLGGNSWSDYPGEDTDGNGLGDTLVPYTNGIVGGDFHPVMGNLYADFAVQVPDVVDDPLTLVFLDASRGGFSPTDQWVWDMGDGAQAITQNVTHAYAADGSYTVQLTVANPHGQVSTVLKTVHVDSIAPVTTHVLQGTLGNESWHTSVVGVLLNASDDRSGVNHTYYRIDGGNLTTYASRVDVGANGHHNATYFSVDKNGNVETEKVASFRIDRTAPVALDASVNGTLGRAGWHVSDVSVLLNATDDVSGVDRIEYGIDAAPGIAYVDGVPLAQDGVFLVRYKAYDHAGLDSTERNVSVRRDATAPEIHATQEGTLGGGGFWLGPVRINASATDATSGLAFLNYTLDGGDETPVNGTIVVSGHGIHAVNLTATDAAGNVNETTQLIVQIDLSAPASEHHFNGTLGANGIYVSPVNVTFTGNDTLSGIDRYVYSLDGGENLSYEGPFGVAIDGQHMLRYYAVDVAGNAEALHEVVLFLDLAAPTTNLNVSGTPGLNGWWLANATGELTVDDPSSLDRILYALDGGGELTYVSPFAIAGEGIHNVTFHSVSLGGLVEENNSRAVRIDLAPPALGHAFNGTAGLDGWHVSPVTVSLTPTDAASGIATTKLGLDGAEPTTYTGPRVVGSTGEHTIAANTTDVAGRVTQLANASFKLDVDDPLTTMSVDPATPDGADGWYVTPPLVTLGATDVGAGVASVLLSIDGAPEEPVTGPVVLDEGVHTLAYRALDLAGRAEPLRNATVKVDLAPPALDELLNGTLGLEGWFTSPVDVTLAPVDATSGVAQVFASVDGGPEGLVTGPIRLAHTRAHTLAWRAVDAAGLDASEILTVKVDRWAPTTTPSVTPPANGFGWRNRPANVTLSATDQPGLGSGVAAIEQGLDGAALSAYTGTFQVGEGVHDLSFRGIDVAGLANATTTLPVRVDLTPPTVATAMRAPDRADGWHMASVPVNLTATDALSGVRTVEHWIDDGGVSSTTGRVVTLTTEGAHVLHVRARDFADVLAAPVDVPYKLDINAPTSTHTLTGTLGGSNRTVAWYRTPVDFTMSSVDAGAGVAAKLYRLDGGANESYAGVVTFAEERSYNLTYFATDLVDRVEPLRAAPRFGVDLTPPATIPVIDGTLDPEDGVYKTVVEISLAADDLLSGAASNALKYRLDNGTFQTYAGTLRFDVSGDYVVEFFATDVAGNVEPVQRLAFTVFVDTTPPVTTLSPAPSGWFGEPVVLRLSATDAQSTVQAVLVRVDGGDLVETLGNTTDVPLDEEGVHTVEYAALDIAGNLELFRTATYQVDLTPPGLDVAESSTAGREGWLVSPVVLTPDATDALSGVARVVAEVNGVEQTLSGPLTLAQSGFYNVSLVAFDVAGLASETFQWSGKLDLDAPRPNVVTVGPEGLAGWFRNNVSVLMTATDVPSGVSALEYRWDNGTWEPYPGAPFQFVDEGAHWLDVRVTDVAGNLGALGRVVGLDHTAPLVTTDLDGVEGDAGWWVSAVTATTSVEDLPGTPGVAVSGVHNLTRRADGGPNATAALPDVVSFTTSGVHTLSAFALDVALNGAGAALEIPVDLDDPELVTDLTGPEGLAGWYVGDVTVEALSADVTSGPAAPLLDGAPMLEPIVLSTDGVHELALHARDVAGRLGPETDLPVKIDRLAPEPIANLTGPEGENGWFHGDTTVTLGMLDATSGPGAIRYRVDNGTLQTYAGPFTLSADGMHVIDWVALDVAGNLAERTLTVGIDTQLPTAVANATGERGLGTWWRSAVDVTLNASDPTSGVTSIEYSLDGGAWTPYLGEPITVSNEGRHMLEYRAIDGSGLPSLVYSHEILIDVTTPVVDLHLENTLYIEYDGVLYVNGMLCVEVSGLDLISGLESLFLKVTGTVTKLVKIDLDVGLTCVDLAGGGGGGGGGGGCEICALAADLAGNEEVECFDAVFDPGPPTVDIVRPFPGALNLQNATIPLFKTAFQQGVTLDTPGIMVEQETPDGTIRIGEQTTVRGENRTLAETTLVAGTRVPVWVAASDARSPITKVELRVDDVVVGATNTTQNVTFQYVVTQPSDTDRSGAEPTLQVPPEPASNETPDWSEHDVRVVNVTMPVYVFEIDTLALPSGDHNLTASAFDVPGNLGKITELVGYVSPAVGNATADVLDATLADRSTVKGEAPNEARDAFPLGTWDEVPDEDIPPMPEPARERVRTFLAAARIAGQLYDFLAIDNYAFVDRTVIEWFDAYAAADEATASLPQVWPTTHVDGVATWIRLVDGDAVADLVPQELPAEPPAIPPEEGTE